MKLKTLKPRFKTLDTRTAKPDTVASRRVTGRSLQNKRWQLWKKNPHCAMCGRLVAYPYGFDMDHVVPLALGGADDESNVQILCNGPEGCHAAKTRQDLADMHS